MFGREPNMPLHTIVRLQQPEALEPQDFIRNRMIAHHRKFLAVMGKYQIYFNRTVKIYKAKSLIGDKSVQSQGTSRTPAIRWSRPGEFIKHTSLALLGGPNQVAGIVRHEGSS